MRTKIDVLPDSASCKKPVYRVLQVFHGLGVGGAETWLIALLRYFKDAQNELPFDVKFDICLTGGEKAVFDDEAISLGAKLHYLRYSRTNLTRFIRGFRKLLANGKYHAIHDHQDYTAGFHFLFGLGHLPPVRIAHVHNPLLHIAKYSSTPLRRFTVKAGKSLLARTATHIMGTSKQMISDYGFDEAMFSHQKVGAVHCGFDVGAYQGDYQTNHNQLCKEFGWDEHVKIILFVGRLDSNWSLGLNQKNPEFALDVAKACIAKNSNVRLLMAGAGDEAKKTFELRVREWGLADKIRLIGVRNDVPRLMIGADLLLFPSLAEGLGMVAVEAQAAGLRVLASDTVPYEIVVVPDTCEFHSLNDGSELWANHALRLMSLERPDMPACNLAVKNSAFSIENSAARLLEMYTKGCL